jgi:hypothetical protein
MLKQRQDGRLNQTVRSSTTKFCGEGAGSLRQHSRYQRPGESVETAFGALQILL